MTRVEVKDILPDQSIKIALEKQMTAERVKRADILESEGQRDASVNMADGQARAALRIAEGKTLSENTPATHGHPAAPAPPPVVVEDDDEEKAKE